MFWKPFLFAAGVVSAGATVTALSMTWVVVSVNVPADGLRLWIPAPVVLAQSAAAFADHPELHREIDVEPQHLRMAAAVLKELEAVEDAELVRVESGDELVVIRKEGPRVHIEVDSGDERVRVYAPVRQIRELLEDLDGEPLRPSAVFRLARSLPSGPLVEVSQPGTDVAVAVW
jgi:hypothetical protein